MGDTSPKYSRLGTGLVQKVVRDFGTELGENV